ncbi:MAG: hypothetical protein JWO32_1951 [Bacteroidetes bacterium]|nr:hypothetical protein [Bacteroidota bacterium]
MLNELEQIASLSLAKTHWRNKTKPCRKYRHRLLRYRSQKWIDRSKA